MQTNVIELGARLATIPEARQMAAILKVGPAIADAMEVVMPELPRAEQRIVCAIVAFRLMGAMLPASLSLLEHLPPTASMSEADVMAAAQNLVDGGVIDGITKGDEMCFSWQALERLVVQAIMDMDAPSIVGPDGNKIR